VITSLSPHDVYPIFSRHETFHPRYGWLKKGFDKASENGLIFSKEDAPIVLGVGKNMVSAIRYWCLAFKVLEQVSVDGKKGSLAPTDFGSRMLNEGGWDSFLEDSASLWLFHWKLLEPPCHAASWHFFFSEYNKQTFSADDVKSALKDFKAKNFPTTRISESSLIKDVHCILRMYAGDSESKLLSEDSIDSPFSELGLLRRHHNGKDYYFNIGPKPGLPAEIISAACLDFSSRTASESRTIALSRLLYEPHSPGMVFKLSESSLCGAIEETSRSEGSLHLSESAGLVQLSYDGDPRELASAILEYYYAKGRN
jgi:Protein of unknown function (DUF4007)